VVKELFTVFPSSRRRVGRHDLADAEGRSEIRYANYHGEAERHWGLVRADGSFKTAYGTFVSGIAEERAAARPSN